MRIEQLDALMRYFESKGKFYTLYTEIIKENPPEFDIEGLIIKLDNDGYLDCGVKKRKNAPIGEWKREGMYKLSYEGFVRLESLPKRFLGKPYAFGKNQQKQSQIWKKAKITAVVLNAIIIILIGVKTCQVSAKENLSSSVEHCKK